MDLLTSKLVTSAHTFEVVPCLDDVSDDTSSTFEQFSSMIQLQYMSDLHLERIKYKYTFDKAGPILILAGDIGRFCDYEPYRDFLEEQCARYDAVILIAGNHEFYGSSREQGLEAAKRLMAEPSMHGRLHFLNRGRFDVPATDVTLLGCTLHSHIAPDYTRLTNDFERIQNWRVATHNAEHEMDYTWLRDSLSAIRQSEPHRKVVVTTHYAPHFDRASHPKNKNNGLAQCFSSHTLENIKKSVGLENVPFWIFGHTHWNTWRSVGRTTVTSNCLCNDGGNLSWWQKKLHYRAFDPQATAAI